MGKFTLSLKMSLCLLVCFILTAFSWPVFVEDEAINIQRILRDHYDDSPITPAIKKYELNFTNNGFCRYRKFYKSGKVEYFSFNIVKFKDLDYYGTDKTGNLYLRTKGDDVIVQTYNDRRGGDIDSMAAFMTIPIKNIEAEHLAELSEHLLKMNALILAQK